MESLTIRLLTHQSRKPVLSGIFICLEHTSITWHQIQSSKLNNRNMIFLDLQNPSFGLLPHNQLEGFDLQSLNIKI